MFKFALLFLAATLLDAQSRLHLVGEPRLGVPTFFSTLAGWAPGEGPSLWRTSDGGKTWSKIAVPASDFGVFFQSPSELWLLLSVGLADFPEISSSYDGGNTWHNQLMPAGSWFVHSLLSRNQGNRVWIGGERAEGYDAPQNEMECPQRVRGSTWVPVMFYRGSSKSQWEEQTLPVHNGCPVSIIKFIDDQRGIATAGSAIMFTRDAGKHWRRSALQLPRIPAQFRRLVASVQFRGDEVWIGCENGEILNSTDGGEHLTIAAAEATIWARARGFGGWGEAYFVSHAIGFTLGGDGELFETRDHARTWKKVATPERVTGLSCVEGQCWAWGDGKLFLIDNH